MTLAAGGEPSLPGGGGLARVMRETGAPTTRGAVETLADRWFRAVPLQQRGDNGAPLLNRPDLGESEKLHLTLTEHVVGRRRAPPAVESAPAGVRALHRSGRRGSDAAALAGRARRHNRGRRRPGWIRQNGAAACRRRWLRGRG